MDWKLLSSAIVGKSLSISQLGSASELSETLLLLTSLRPQAWTEDYSGKTSSSKRLRQYIQKGSQGGTSKFWSNLDELLRKLPQEVLAEADKTSTDEEIKLSSAIALTEAFQEGLKSREEPRQNLYTGWKSYIEITLWLGSLLPEEQRPELIQKRLSPLVTHFVRPDPELTQWSLPTQSTEQICIDYLSALVAHDQYQEIELLWSNMSNGLLEAVKLSSPEQSKDFRSSQDSICEQSKRLFILEPSVISRSPEASRLKEIFEKSNMSLLDNCLQVLRSRNGKPYGTAGVVEECVRRVPSIAKQSKELFSFLKTDAPELLFSPSGDRLITIILACRQWEGFSSCFEVVVERALELDPEQSNAHVLQSLLSTIDFNEVEYQAKLSSLVMRALDKACRGSATHWPIVTAVLRNQTSWGALMDQVFVSIVESLSTEDRVFDALHGLSHLGKTVPAAVREFQGGSNGSKLTGKLLYLTESPLEEVAVLAESLIKNFKETVVGDTSTKSKIEILQHGFSHASEESLTWVQSPPPFELIH